MFYDLGNAKPDPQGSIASNILRTLIYIYYISNIYILDKGRIVSNNARILYDCLN